MGEVYKATDTRLDRPVAIKILPAGVSPDSGHRARFEREAKSISSLNHPAICRLYDIGRVDDIDYLVMEYLEGETLSDRLQRGPLEVAETLDVAVQVADALDAAHRQGLIHRDLKPGNIMLTRSGAKLLDFGLAKLQGTHDSAHVEKAETQTNPLTEPGTLVGTVQYMSPEQLESQATDARSDLFSFGAVVYEMLTGERAFPGDSRPGVIASILKEQPLPPADANPDVSQNLDRLVRKCLEKDPATRWQTARDLADELRWISQVPERSTVPARAAGHSKPRVRLVWIVAGVSLTVAIILAALLLTRESPTLPVRRLNIVVGDAEMANWPRLSPDGRLLAYRAADSSGQTSIWIRPLDSLGSYRLEDTEGAMRPFWSPDSKAIAFFQSGNLKRMPVSGGPAQVICTYDGGADGTWGREGVILFDGVRSGNAIMQVPSAGGTPTPATARADLEQSHSWPWFLPDGRTFLYLVDDSVAHPTADLVLRVGSLGSPESRELTRIDSRVEYVNPGYLVYVLDSVLVAQRFDSDKLALVGAPIAIDEDVSVWNWGANFSVAEDGTMAYQKGDVVRRSALLWVDRDGKVLDTLGDPAPYHDIALSPDGDRLAFTQVVQRTLTEDVWIYDLSRNIPSRLTFDEAEDIYPAWSRDGRYVLFSSNRDLNYRIYRKAADGTGEAELLYNPGRVDICGFGAWGRDDHHLYIFELRDRWRSGLLSLSDGELSTNYFSSKFNQYTLGTSPDGKWLVYASDESGRWEVYVRGVDASDGKWQVSADGGYDGVWSKDGSEIFFMHGGRTLMAAPVVLGDELQIGTPRPLFSADFEEFGPKRLRYQPSADSQKFLINVRLPTPLASDFVIVLDWLTALPGQ
jgi:serine/threonine protein kinase